MDLDRSLPTAAFCHQRKLARLRRIYSRTHDSRDLAAFLQEGVGIYIGTRNAALEPNGARALAALVGPGGLELVVYLADVAATRLMPDLDSNGQAAVTFGRPVDERTIQVKGTFVSARQARDDERPASTHSGELHRSLETNRVARKRAERLAALAAIAIALKPTALFETDARTWRGSNWHEPPDSRASERRRARTARLAAKLRAST
jgi:hypothetical protein